MANYNNFAGAYQQAPNIPEPPQEQVYPEYDEVDYEATPEYVRREKVERIRAQRAQQNQNAQDFEQYDNVTQAVEEARKRAREQAEKERQAQREQEKQDKQQNAQARKRGEANRQHDGRERAVNAKQPAQDRRAIEKARSSKEEKALAKAQREMQKERARQAQTALKRMRKQEHQVSASERLLLYLAGILLGLFSGYLSYLSGILIFGEDNGFVGVFFFVLFLGIEIMVYTHNYDRVGTAMLIVALSLDVLLNYIGWLVLTKQGGTMHVEWSIKFIISFFVSMFTAFGPEMMLKAARD